MKKCQRLNHPLLMRIPAYSPLIPVSASVLWRSLSVLVLLTAVFSVAFSHLTMAEGSLNEASKAQAGLPTVELLIHNTALTAEVASSHEQRYMGLSFRTRLADNEAMLFAYPSERSLTFTMRNTLIPLSIAYISKDMVINEIVDMDVGPDQLFPAKQKAQFALEVNQGWFRRNGIEAGALIVMR